MSKEIQTTSKIAIFKGKQIRKTIHKNEWWFVVNDVIQILTDSTNTSDYLKKMSQRDAVLSEGWGQIVTPPFYRDIWWQTLFVTFALLIIYVSETF